MSELRSVWLEGGCSLSLSSGQNKEITTTLIKCASISAQDYFCNTLLASVMFAKWALWWVNRGTTEPPGSNGVNADLFLTRLHILIFIFKCNDDICYLHTHLKFCRLAPTVTTVISLLPPPRGLLGLLCPSLEISICLLV